MTDLRMIGAVAVVHNAAPELADADDEPPSYAADAEIVEVAQIITSTLQDLGIPAQRYCADPSPQALIQTLKTSSKHTCIFNLVEGIDGEAWREAQFARELERAQLTFTGSPSSALAIAFRKDHTRKVLAAAKVPQAEGFVVSPDQELRYPARYPVFLKPANADGSIGIDMGSVIWDDAAYRERAQWIFTQFGCPCLVERYLPGAELNVAYVPSPDGEAIFSATAIDFSGYPSELAPIVSYDCKWTPGSPEYVAQSVPATTLVDDATIAQAISAAKDAIAALGVRGYGRVDLRLDERGQAHVIDVNPNPDLHPEAGLAIAASHKGLSYPELILGIFTEAYQRHTERTLHERISAHSSHHRRRPRYTGHFVATH